MIYKKDVEKLSRIILNETNFGVVIDFDNTLTKGLSGSTWNVVGSEESFGPEFKAYAGKLYEKYRPIEVSSEISDEEKSKYMTEWWTESITYFGKFGLTKSNLKNAVLNHYKNDIIAFRDGAKEFLKSMDEKNIPVVILSAGIGNVIEDFLDLEEANYNNVYVVSNLIEFEGEKYKGMKGEIIHSMNKSIDFVPSDIKDLLHNRPYKLLIGDVQGDIKMVPDEELPNTIAIGFVEDEEDEIINQYKELFDVVLSQDETFETVNKILNIY